MRVFLLRHGIAAPPAAGKSDESRALTLAGKKKMGSAARGMKTLDLKFDRILCSPLTRCRQTAEAVMKTLKTASPAIHTAALAPDTRSSEILKAVLQSTPTSSLLLVGHEPSLSHFASFLLTGQDRGMSLDFKKGGLCRIDFSGKPRPGTGTLVFHLTPKALRRLGRKSR